MARQHVQKTGAKAGQWVTCGASVKENCRNKGTPHFDSTELIAAQEYYAETLDVHFDLKTMDSKVVLEYKLLADWRKEEIAAKISQKKMIEKHEDEMYSTLKLRKSRSEASQMFEKAGGLMTSKVYTKFFTPYPNINKLSIEGKAFVFGETEILEGDVSDWGNLKRGEFIPALFYTDRDKKIKENNGKLDREEEKQAIDAFEYNILNASGRI